MYPVTERNRDEMHLAWLDLSKKGKGATAIAKLYGVSKGTVIGQLQRIRRDVEASEGSA